MFIADMHTEHRFGHFIASERISLGIVNHLLYLLNSVLYWLIGIIIGTNDIHDVELDCEEVFRVIIGEKKLDFPEFEGNNEIQ